MSFLRSLFFKSKEDDFETVLSKLHDDIQRRQSKLSELRLRERRSTLLVTLYTLAIWCAYTTIWYLILRERGEFLLGLPVFVGPIGVLFVRRIVQVWYKRKGDAEERTLQGLRKTQRTKVDEFKKKTNFNATRSLLEKYDDSAPKPPISGVINKSGPAPVPGGGSVMSPMPMTPKMNGTRPRQSMVGPSALSLSSAATPLPPHLMALGSPQPYTPPRKQWYDKLADAILGDDDGSPGAGEAANRYALICEQCFKHNGLVKASMWEDAQYVCPKCGHFNASERSKRSSRGGPRSSSPLSASSPLSDRPEPETPSQPRPPVIQISSESMEPIRLSDDEDAGSVRSGGSKKARARGKKGKLSKGGADESLMDVDGP